MNKIIKLFITDIDGVLTDGGMYYDQKGNEFKRFCTSDSAGIEFLKIIGIPTAIITGEDTEIVRSRAKKLNISYLFMGVKNKYLVARDLCKKLNITMNEVAYIGDDLNDIILLKAVGLSAAPFTAPIYIQKVVNWVIPVKGGEGAYRYFVEQYLKEYHLLDEVIDKYVEQNFKSDI